MTRKPETEVARSEQVIALLRKAILRGSLQPGEHLSQTQLALDYAISKVPVREALKQLAAEGLLSHDRNRGYFVARLSADEAHQLYRMRRWMESELLASARWPSDAELRRLRALLAEVSVPLTPDNREKWLDALARTRFLIFDLSPQKVLLREAMRLWTLTDRFRALLPADKSPTGETALVEALASRDREQLLSAHRRDRDRIEQLLDDALDMLPPAG